MFMCNICVHRDTRKIMLNIEHKIMMQMAPNNAYDLLTHPQKLEVCVCERVCVSVCVYVYILVIVYVY